MIAIAITLSLFLVLLYGSCRRWAAAAARMRELRQDQDRLKQEITGARSAALQARLEPVPLRESLEQIRSLYAQDSPQAERALDLLVADLRAQLRPVVPG